MKSIPFERLVEIAREDDCDISELRRPHALWTASDILNLHEDEMSSDVKFDIVLSPEILEKRTLERFALECLRSVMQFCSKNNIEDCNNVIDALEDSEYWENYDESYCFDIKKNLEIELEYFMKDEYHENMTEEIDPCPYSRCYNSKKLAKATSERLVVMTALAAFQAKEHKCAIEAAFYARHAAAWAVECPQEAKGRGRQLLGFCSSGWKVDCEHKSYEYYSVQYDVLQQLVAEESNQN